ncbi:hypothetical protein BSPWISOX_2112 [uncultured Gammaproteobacteria bacterium]|nr:hypothetical protein BSPWISOX_2112 [uncultured Gammaproteobacteria bacterium]
MQLVVHHHIGGLEIHTFNSFITLTVHHHIGGLEKIKQYLQKQKNRSPPHRWLRKPVGYALSS